MPVESVLFYFVVSNFGGRRGFTTATTYAIGASCAVLLLLYILCFDAFPYRSSSTT